MADYEGSPAPRSEFSPVPDLVETVYERRKLAGKHQGDWRGNAREDFEFLAGDQWDGNDKAKLEEQGRPVVVFNRVAPIIESVVGLEINNRQRISYKPRTYDDAPINEMYDEAARFVRDQSDAEDEESDAFRDAATCGMGWIHTHVDYDEEPDGKIMIERVPPLEMRWDPQARKANLTDATWVMREKRMLLADVRERWPGRADDIQPSPVNTDIDEAGEHDATDAWKYENDQAWTQERVRDDKVVVLHYQWREREPFYRVGDPETGRVVEFTTARYERLRERVEAMGTPSVRQHRWRYRQAFVAGNTLLEEGDAPINGFSYRPITGKRDEQHGTWHGLMRPMKDPQRWANKWLAQSMHIFNTNSKGGVLVEEGAVNDIREFEENWASSDGVVVVEDGALSSGRIQQKDFGGYPAALDKLLAFAIRSVRDCVGVNLEMLGMADREQAQVLEMERKKAALVILAPLMNSLRRYRKQHGSDLLAFMRAYLPAGTVIRATGKEQEVKQFYKDDAAVRYDVIVDTAPDSPNLKEEVWQTLAQLVPSLIKAGVPLPPDLIRFSPLPAHVAEQWVKYIDQKTQGPPPEMMEQIKKLQEELEKVKTENESLKTKAQVRVMETRARYQDKEQDRQHETQHRNADRAVKIMDVVEQGYNDYQDSAQRDADRAIEIAQLVQQSGETEMREATKLTDIAARYDAERRKAAAAARRPQGNSGG